MHEGFDDDLASRYAETLETLVGQDTGTDWADYDQAASHEIAAGPEQTVAGLAWNFDSVYGTNLQSLVQSGDYARAAKYREDMRNSIEANRDALLGITRALDVRRGSDGSGPGQVTLELAKRAKSLLMYDFDNAAVRMSDGSQATVGQVLGPGSPYLAQRQEDIVSQGFGDNVAEMYLRGSAEQRRVMKNLVDPIVSVRTRTGTAPAVVPNRWQLVNLANDVANNWDRLTSAFGDGLVNFVDYVRSSHEGAGNASAAMRTLTELAESMSAGGAPGGKSLAARVVNGYNDLRLYAFQGDGNRAVPAAITPGQAMLFDAAVVPAVGEALRRGVPFDFRSPSLRSAMRSVADTVAYVSGAGADLLTESRDKGYDLNGDLADYLANAIEGRPPRSGNIVETVGRIRRTLDQTLVGGERPEALVGERTGRSRDYVDSVDRSNSMKSECPEADGMALSAKQYILRALLPHLANGKRVDDAFRDAVADRSRAGSFVGGLADQLAPSFHGRGAGEAARTVAGALVDAVMNGRATSVKEVVKNLSLDEEFRGRSPEGHRSVAAWYNGNVANAEATAELRQALTGHLAAMGYKDFQIRRIVSNVASKSSTAQSLGSDPLGPYRAALGVGRVRIPVYDEKGSLVDVQTQIRPLDKVSFDFYNQGSSKPVRIAPGTYSGDPMAWELVQGQLEQDEKRLEALRKEARRLAMQKQMADYRKDISKELADYRQEDAREMADYREQLRARRESDGVDL